MNIQIMKISAMDWKVHFSENAHLISFVEKRPASMDRIDYALLAVEPEKNALGFATIRELDAESAYIQYGGPFPTIKSTINIYKVYQKFLDLMQGQYKRLTCLVENDNLPYLKLAMKCGFRIIGVRTFKGSILVELLKEFDDASTVESTGKVYVLPAPGDRKKVGGANS